MHDMPLVIFTVLSQLVIGGFITLWWLDRTKGGMTKKTGLLLSVILVIIGGAAVIVSLLHLGQPLHAYRAILNIKVSWLSREVTFYGTFVGLAGLYGLFWLKENAALRSKIGWAASIIGIIAIYSSAKIYMIPSVPAWNSVTTLLAFFLTALLLGPLFVGFILAIRKELHVDMTKFAFVAILATVAMIVVYFSMLQGGLPQAVEVAKATIGQGLFWLRTGTILLAVALLGFAMKKKTQPAAVYSAVFTLLLISEFLARFQFYDTAVHL